jgi:hypothetical protein
VSGTRLPTRPQAGLDETESLDDLEELGDDAIIAQQTAAHAPQPRAIVSEESRSVVISDHPPIRDTQPPRSATFPRSTGEPTLIIRDRRALDEMRQQIVERQVRNKSRRSRSIYVWGALGLAAFVLGGIVAFLATDTRSDAPLPSADSPATPSRVEAQIQSPSTANAARPAATAAAQAVRLDDLPVEKKK